METLKKIRNPYLYVIVFLLQASQLHAQKNLQVLDWKSESTLNSYLIQGMHKLYGERARSDLHTALSSRKEALRYISRVRKDFRDLLGELPQRSPLNAAITGTVQRDGYRIEKVVYESFPKHHVTANLYLPSGKGPFAAALFLCGHEDLSKATESYQKTAILFAKNGFAVLVIDPISQSERYQLVDSTGKPLTRGGTTEHTLLNSMDNLFGGSAAADELWDNVRGLDYLITRKEVDTSRIGCLGNSGGGMQTIYLAAFDPRIKVLAPCSYLSSRERTMELSGAADGCAQIPGEGAYHLELSDYLIAAAPRPVLVLAGRYDFIDYTGAQQAYSEIGLFYKTLGLPEQASFYSYDDGHGISQPKRERAVSWFRQWLYKDKRPIHEDSLTLSTPKELQVTTTGQVSTAYPGEISIAQRNLSWFDKLAPQRAGFLQLPKQKLFDSIRSVLEIPSVNRPVGIERNGTVSKTGLTYEKLILRCGDEPPLPALLLLPEGSPKGLTIFFSDKGKARLTDSIVMLHSYLQQGKAVLLADLRGFGETEDPSGFNDPKYYNREYRNDMLALHNGSNIIGQRVLDIETVLQLAELDNRLRGLPVEIRASGLAALPALHAAVLAPQVQKWHLDMPILSYREMLMHPEQQDWYSFVIPRVLWYYDIPDLIHLVGKEKLDISSTHSIYTSQEIQRRN